MQISLLSSYFWRTKRSSLVLIFLTIYISITSFYSMNGFIEGLKKKIYHSARNMSAGDIKVQTWQNWREDWDTILNDTLGQNYTRSDMIQFPTMLNVNDKTFLVSIKAVDSFYPFYGEVKLIDDTFQPLKVGEGYIAQEAAMRFQIKVGDVLNIGSTSVKLKGLIEELPDEGFSGVSAFGPNLLVSIQTAEKSQLLQFGSRVSRLRLYKSNDPAFKQEWIEKDSETLEKKIASEFIQISTWKDAQNMSRNLFERMSSYFNILTYTSIILSSVGLFLGLSSFVFKIQRDVALLHTMGVSKRNLKSVLFITLGSLVFGGIALGVATGLIAENYLLKTIEDMVALHDRTLNYELIFFATLFGVLSCGLIVYFSISKFIKRLSAFDHQVSFAEHQFSIYGFLVYIFFIFSLLGFYSWVQSASLKDAMILNGLILALLLLLFLFVYILLFVFQRLLRFAENDPVFFLASVEFFRNKKKHLPSLIALVLSSVLILGLIATRDGLTKKLSVKEDKESANVFLVDIQKSQLDDVNAFIDKEEDYKHFNYSPLLRATLVHINDVSVEELKVIAEKTNNLRRQQFLSRSYNLTYKDELNQSEKIVKGKFWDHGYSGEEISLEVDFAERMGLKIGDRVGFDLAGVAIDGKVASIRAIDWGSLLPNFFIVFPKKKLESAPQFIIGSAFVKSEKRPIFQNQLHDAFPNISVVDLETIFKRVQTLLSKVASIIFVSAMLCLASSLVILFLALFGGDEEIGQKSTQMKSVGLNAKAIRNVFVYEKYLYCATILVSVFFLLFIWNIGLAHYLKEDVEFSFTYFGLYFLTLLGLIFSPLFTHKWQSKLMSRSV